MTCELEPQSEKLGVSESPVSSNSARPVSVKPRVIRNVASNWGAYVLAMGVNFFLSPYVVRHLGNTGYGVWTLILSLTGYLGLLDLAFEARLPDTSPNSTRKQTMTTPATWPRLQCLSFRPRA